MKIMYSCNNPVSIQKQFSKDGFRDGFTNKNKYLKSKTWSPSISISLTFVILLSSLSIFSQTPSISAETDHFQAKPSLDSDENIGKGIDEWPNSAGESQDGGNTGLSSVISNSTGSRSSQEFGNFTNSSTLTNSSEVLTEEEQEELEWRDGNQERRSHTRFAAVAVYGSVILIALFGVLIKYFVTQYETLQAKAQLEYQQLRNVQCH